MYVGDINTHKSIYIHPEIINTDIKKSMTDRMVSFLLSFLDFSFFTTKTLYPNLFIFSLTYTCMYTFKLIQFDYEYITITKE